MHPTDNLVGTHGPCVHPHDALHPQITRKTKKEQKETEVYHSALPLSSAVRTGLEPATPSVTG